MGALIETLKKDPASPEAIDVAIETILASRDTPGLLEMIEELAHETNEALHLFVLSQALHQVGRFDDALEALRDGHSDLEQRAFFEGLLRRHSPRWQERIRFYWANQAFGLVGKDVLEVGGRLPAEFVAAANPSSWTALDPKNADETVEAHVLKRGDAADMPFPDDAFDLVFSSSAFEHIAQLAKSLSEMHRVLRPDGIMYSDFGPIWSAANGHHMRGPAVASLKKAGLLPFPDWGHLTMSLSELRSYLSRGLEPDESAGVERAIHRRPSLNRWFYEDYVHSFHASPFQVVRIDPKIGEEPPDDVKDILRRRQPGRSNFHVNGFRVVLRKKG
jgi:ubiquinone/menaquinone biosynthesis C-methylase UbiE